MKQHPFIKSIRSDNHKTVEIARLEPRDPYFTALNQIIDACQATDYRDPLSHAQIADIAKRAIGR